MEWAVTSEANLRQGIVPDQEKQYLEHVKTPSSQLPKVRRMAQLSQTEVLPA